MKKWLATLWSDVVRLFALRDRFHKWLGLEVELKNEVLLAMVKFGADLSEDLNTRDEALRNLIGSTAQGLQEQITDLQSHGVIAGAKPKPVEEAQIDRGHMRFTQRKKKWEADHRQPMTETGKQIEENSRLIASGTRKPDSPSS